MAFQLPVFLKRLLHAMWFRAGALIAVLVTGCATPPPPPASAPEADAAQPVPAAEQAELRISELYLSPGDEIKVTVFQHEELDRSIRIPPSGRIFYPIVGEIDTTGMSMEGLRTHITDGLAGSGDNRFEVGDEANIRIFRHDDLTTRALVMSDGTLQVPLAGRVAVQGLTRAEATEAVQVALSAYLKSPQVILDVVSASSSVLIENPQVSVEAVKLSGQKIAVLGEVARPGVFVMDAAMSLADAISMAGGTTQDAEKRSVVLVHTRGGNREPKLLNLSRLLKEGDLSQNPALQTGDLVYVPRSFIASVDRFFEHLTTVVRPIVDIESGIWLGQNIDEGPSSFQRASDPANPTSVILSR